MTSILVLTFIKRWAMKPMGSAPRVRYLRRSFDMCRDLLVLFEIYNVCLAFIFYIPPNHSLIRGTFISSSLRRRDIKGVSLIAIHFADNCVIMYNTKNHDVSVIYFALIFSFSLLTKFFQLFFQEALDIFFFR